MMELPVGRDDFADIRKSGEYYSDKTGLLCDLAKREVPYFLSRPRRFGKTLLLNTLEYILRGREDLFKGLEIESRGWDWTPRPVIKLQMNGISNESLQEMEQSLKSNLIRIAKRDGINLDPQDPSVSMLGALIESLYEKYGNKKVAILIDEYDTPIIRLIDEPKRADAIRKKLGLFYNVLKTQEERRGLVFVTGVSRFAKASIFSELNNLKDLTIGGRCAEICGLTEADIGKLIEGLKDNMLRSLVANESLPKGATPEDLRRLIQDWYDGYSWDGVTRVYNPWSVLNCFQDAMISSYWVESGSSSSLHKLVKNGKINFDITKNISKISNRDTFIHEIDKINAEGFLFQTGYLTIENMLPGGNSYGLRFPNLEVSASLPPLLLNIPPPDDPIAAKRCADSVVKALFELNGSKLEKAFSSYLNTYPYELFDDRLEKIYHTIFISCMHIANQHSTAFDMTAKGRLDCKIVHKNDIYIIEFKRLRSQGKGGSDNEDEPPNGAKEAAREAKAAKSKSDPTKAAKKSEALRGRMANLAKVAFKQIEEKYAPKYANEPGRLIMVAMVVAKRTEVYAEFEVSEPSKP